MSIGKSIGNQIDEATPDQIARLNRESNIIYNAVGELVLHHEMSGNGVLNGVGECVIEALIQSAGNAESVLAVFDTWVAQERENLQAAIKERLLS